jgi:retinol dehydrogenase-12
MGNTILAGLPSSPAFTEANVPTLNGRVFIVTGASSGLEEQAASILGSKQAKVYIAARSETKCLAAIERIKSHAPDSKGSLIYLHMDLSDLSTIKASAREHLSKEERLDDLLNNAGVMLGPKGEGSKTAQGYEIQLGTNCVGPFLFTQLLQSILYHTARIAPTDSGRIVWVSSDSIKNYNPPNGIDISNLDYHTDKSGAMKYGIRKAGNMFHASEFARQSVEKGENIISVSPNPGTLKSHLTRSVPSYLLVLTSWMLKPPIFGAYTEVFAAFSLEVNQSRNGRHIVPWRR